MKLLPSHQDKTRAKDYSVQKSRDYARYIMKTPKSFNWNSAESIR